MDTIVAIPTVVWSATTDTITYLSNQSPISPKETTKNEEVGEDEGEFNVLGSVTNSLFSITSVINPMTYVPVTSSEEAKRNEEVGKDEGEFDVVGSVTNSFYSITSVLNSPSNTINATPADDILSVNGIFSGVGSGATYMFDMTASLTTTLTPRTEGLIAMNFVNGSFFSENQVSVDNSINNPRESLNEELTIDPSVDKKEYTSVVENFSVYDIMMNGPVELISTMGSLVDVEKEKPKSGHSPVIRRISQDAFPLTNTLMSNIFGSVVTATDDADNEIHGIPEVNEEIFSSRLTNSNSNDVIHYSKILNKLALEIDKECINDAFKLLDKGIDIKKINLFKNQDETYKLYCDRQMHTIYWRPNKSDTQGIFSKKNNSDRFITIKDIISVHICENKNKVHYLSIEHVLRSLDVEMDGVSMHTIFEALQLICNKVNNVADLKTAKKSKISSLLSSKKVVKSS